MATRSLVPVQYSGTLKPVSETIKPPTSRIPLLRDSSLDSLAYLDNEVEVAALRPEIETLVAEEAFHGPLALSGYKSMLPAVTNTPSLRATSSFLPAPAVSTDGLDFTGCEILPRAPEPDGATDNLSEWQGTLRSLDALVCCRSLALINVGFHARFGPAVWKLDMSDLEQTLAAALASLRSVRSECGVVNTKRKAYQLRASSRLGKLHRSYRSFLARNRALTIALRQLEHPPFENNVP